MAQTWEFGPADGDLLIRTGVEGRAARLGHRLTIAMTQWRCDVTLRQGIPAIVDVVVAVTGLRVRHGEAGVKPLTEQDLASIRDNALGCMAAARHPCIEFHAAVVAPTESGYRVPGMLQVCGNRRPLTLAVTVAAGAFEARGTVRQTDFGIRPYSQLMGSLKVSDEVVVECSVGQQRTRWPS